MKQCERGGSFGELALLYNAPRAATVVAASRTALWTLDRKTFKVRFARGLCPLPMQPVVTLLPRL